MFKSHAAVFSESKKKTKSFLCLITHYVIKICGGGEGEFGSIILYMGSGRRWVIGVKATSSQEEKSSVLTGWGNGWAPSSTWTLRRAE
jgi:hypothetical protein